ncbi:O-antigen ligase family protein [Dickeya sp. CFBP 2040]|uniref:O-antigen ligase family protein n=1 Tax=Dickeya sp. CFBP 2040 TaxID=2718531 RepID=UPI0014470622|nr:O-antigen ligase family protein [Dickeya sp. CFBP 2040]NKI74535.1 O-antigen ligase family protein [Dickeya sp. CFBP 2040]
MLKLNKKIAMLFLLSMTLLLCAFWASPSQVLPFHRNFLIYGVFFISIVFIFKDRTFLKKVDYSKIKDIAWVLAIMTMITLTCGIFFSPAHKEMFRAWHSQWLRPLMLFAYGLIFYPLVSTYVKNISTRGIITAIIVSFWAPIFVHTLSFFYIFFKKGSIPWGETYIFPSRLELSFQINLISMVIFTDLFLRIFNEENLLTLKTRTVAFLVIIDIIATAFSNTRWGTVGMIMGLLSIGFIFLIKKAKKTNLIKASILIGLITAFILSVGIFSYKEDPRWKGIEEDIIIGWNVPSNSFCFIFENQDKITPLRKDGTPANHSNTCRIAYFHQASNFIIEHPLGLGTSKTAFLYRLQEKYRNPSIDISHSHSGILEYGLQYGIIGILLWIGYNLLLLKKSYHAFFKENKAAGIVLFLISGGFLFRSAVDRILLDHYMEEYMFLCGLLLSLISYRDSQDKK